MTKIFTLLLLLCSIAVTAQTQPFAKVDTADLKLTSCDFEKGANAMVLFDEAKVYYKYSTVVMERHKRIKIFNEKGSDQAQVKIEYLGVNHDEFVTDVEAQTINFEDKDIKYIPVDKALIYKQNIDRETNAIVFTFPNVKPGSIVEFKYKWSSPYAGNFPNWLFQDVIPTRYSEFQCNLNNNYIFKLVKRIRQNFAKDTSVFKNGKNKRSGYTHIWALSNVHSLRDEPYMASMQDNVQELLFQVTGRFRGYWSEEALGLLKYDDFGAQLDTTINLSHQESIIAEASKLPGRDEKIAYLFNTVKNTIKWNNLTRFYTEDGVRRAWNRKTGNSAEINMILYHYLKKAGINAQVMVINTHDKLDPYYASTHQLNSLVAYVIDDKTQYVLDASQKDGLYNELPFYLLNSNGVVIYQERKVAMLLDLNNPSPKQNAIFINAEITPDARMTGTAQINNSSYNKMSVIKRYKADGEAGYKSFLQEKDNNLKITSLKLENMEVDSLPLTQTIEFNSDLNGSDENYIYFAPNLFTGLNLNPFLDEERYSHIDFKFLRRYNINGRYKIPAGFKIEAIPKSLTVLMPDSSISFKRMVAEEEGFVIVHYIVDFKRSYYAATEYQLLYEFYKKMYEMLNEQIILKKG